MKIGIPKNIYAAIFALSLPEEYKENLIPLTTSMISSELEKGNCDIALIPSCDLLTHKEFKVSTKIALSFDGDLSNAKIYFKDDSNSFETVYLQGDVSSNEIILSKIIFSERFETEIEIVLDTEEFAKGKKNYILVGNSNLDDSLVSSSISFADQVAEFLDYPYTEFVLASKNEDFVKKLSSDLKGLDKKIENNITQYLQRLNFSDEINKNLLENIHAVYFELTENERTGLSELLRIPYFHGLIKEIVDINFVD
ncbi:MAG: hypothetical protein JEY94_02435 [Melioribacteraceae bacterium]|nr:hypothetical protein [Melioribacteraceae bacterium]